MDIYQNLRDIMESVSPLSYKEQKKLIAQSQSGDTEARNQLVLTNLPMISKVANEFDPPGYFTMNDLINEGVIALMRAIDKKDLTKEEANLYLFFTEAIRWHLIDFIKKESKWESRTESLSLSAYDPSDSDAEESEKMDFIEDPRSNSMIHEMENRESIKTYLAYCKPEEQVIIILNNGVLGFKEYSIKEIQKILKMKHPAIISKKKQALERMAQSKKDPEKYANLPPPYKLINLDNLKQMIKDHGLIEKRKK